ncbi:MAG: DUF5916 domain-containing protein [Longimicrobiales bacterium]
MQRTTDRLVSGASPVPRPFRFPVAVPYGPSLVLPVGLALLFLFGVAAASATPLSAQQAEDEAEADTTSTRPSGAPDANEEANDARASETPTPDDSTSVLALSGNQLILQATRVEEGPTLDGFLNDPVWDRATVADGFIQQEPNTGDPVSETTEVLVLYDGETLYLGVRALDRGAPGGLVATEMRRDAGRILEEDNFQVILDTFHDERSGYMFVTTPLGAKLDQQVSNEGGRSRSFGTSSDVNRDWDGVWYVETRTTDEGWIAEIAIPMVTLRFSEASEQQWGVNFMRNIRRKNEQAYWAPMPQAYDLMRVSMAGDLTDLRSLERGMDLRVKPYVAGGGRRIVDGGVTDNSTQSDVGLDIKYGVTAGLNLDVTVNTDFAQAEVDDEQVNLTRFALFYPEKRDFFLENAGQFMVGSTSSIRPIVDLFFSRRIGLSQTGQPVPILGGARLTGKVGPNSIALMDIQTDGAPGRPGENFLVARYSRDVASASRVGGIFINKEANLDTDGTPGDDYNRTYGLDTRIVPHPALTIDGMVAMTETPGVTDGEMGLHFRAGWLDRSWRIYTEYTDLEDNFNAEVGFVPRVGIERHKLHLEYNPRPDIWGIRVMSPMWNIEYLTDQSGTLMSRRLHNMVGITFDDGGQGTIWYNRDFERLERDFEIQPGIVIPRGSYDFGDWHFSYRSNSARRLFFSATYAPRTFFNGDRTDIRGSTGVRVTDQLAFEGSYSRNDVNLPAGDFVVDIGSLQADLALSPSMSLRSRVQYNSSTEQWTTSGRFRWTYQPGSDLYIVYDEVRTDPTILNEFQDYRDHRLIVKATYLLTF